MRYLVFTFDKYYPVGGWNDFHGQYEDVSEAMQAERNTLFTHGHIVDTTTMKVVSEW